MKTKSNFYFNLRQRGLIINSTSDQFTCVLLVPSQRRKQTRDVTHFSTLVFNDKVTIKRHSGKSTFLLGRIKIICLPTSLSSQNTHEVGRRERPLLPASTLLDRCITVHTGSSKITEEFAIPPKLLLSFTFRVIQFCFQRHLNKQVAK